MGQILITPTLLYLFYHKKRLDIKDFIIYNFFYAVLIYLLQIKIAIPNPFVFFSITIPITLGIVFYKGVTYGMSFNTILALISSFAVYLGTGTFYQVNFEFDNIINYNLFILSHIAIVIIVGTLLEQQKRFERNLQRKIKLAIEKNKQQQFFILQQNRLAQMGEMISMIAHQWRQPLNNLAIINQLLINKYKTNKLDDKVIQYFQKNSMKQIDIMSSTIDDFRNFFKKEKEKVTYNIKDVLENLKDIISPVLISNNISLDISLEKDYQLYGYPNSLFQALLNIINNAKDALMENEKKDKKIKINLFKNDKFLIIKISDNAGGIQKEIINKIFDPYFSTKSKNGTGIGLYMCKMIIEEQMQGKIKVYNDKEGAVFEIYLDLTLR
jgi:signal transduction histidine kinase